MNEALLFVNDISAALQDRNVAMSATPPTLDLLGVDANLLATIARSGALRRELLTILQKQNDQTVRHLIRDHLFDASQQLRTSAKKLRSNDGRKVSALTGGGAALTVAGFVGLAAATISGWIAIPMIAIGAGIMATGFKLGDRANDIANENEEDANCYEELRKMLNY